ncbi:MAG: hypothetical protein IJU02_07280 [Lachnospiraceae bacterium]|nr:hypothetical protein [Lachnospiraceae bacterium]
MEKKICVIKASTIRSLVELMNKEKISKDDIVQFVCNDNEYIVMLYK